jgi:hypothetical protein
VCPVLPPPGRRGAFLGGRSRHGGAATCAPAESNENQVHESAARVLVHRQPCEGQAASFMAHRQETRVRISLFLAEIIGPVAALVQIMTGILSEGAHASHPGRRPPYAISMNPLCSAAESISRMSS